MYCGSASPYLHSNHTFVLVVKSVEPLEKKNAGNRENASKALNDLAVLSKVFLQIRLFLDHVHLHYRSFKIS